MDSMQQESVRMATSASLPIEFVEALRDLSLADGEPLIGTPLTGGSTLPASSPIRLIAS